MKTFLGLVFVYCSIVAAGANGAPPKFLKKASKALNDSDPVQVAVYKALESYPDFAAVLGGAYSEQEQQAFIDRYLTGPLGVDQDKVQQLQVLEATAPSLRSLKIALSGAEGRYSEQDQVYSRNTTQVRKIEWVFEVPVEKVQAKARQLYESVDSLLGKDRKWHEQIVEPQAVGAVTTGLLAKVYQVKTKRSWGGGGTRIEQVTVQVLSTHSAESPQATISLIVSANTVTIHA